MKSTAHFLAFWVIAVASTALADLPDAASAIARIQACIEASTHPPAATNGPSLYGVYTAYLSLPLGVPPAKEAEGWLAVLDGLGSKMSGKDQALRLYLDYEHGRNSLAPFFVRLPSAGAWPAVRKGLATRAATFAPTNVPPLITALQYVFDRLAHDDSAASNRLERLRAATAGLRPAALAFRQLERNLGRKGRLPEGIERYFRDLADNFRWSVSIPSVFLRLSPDRLWQVTAPALTNGTSRIRFENRSSSDETPPAFLALAMAHRGELAASQGFSLVDHTPAGRELYEALLARFDFLSVPPEGDDGEEDVEGVEDIENVDGAISELLHSDQLEKLLAKAQRQKRRPPAGYDSFREATEHVLRGILVRDGFPAACDFAARFPTNFFAAMDIAFSDGGEAEMDFLERFVFTPGTMVRESLLSYVATAMQCGQTARARDKLREFHAQHPSNTSYLLEARIGLAAFDDDVEGIEALSREIREFLRTTPESQLSNYSYALDKNFVQVANLLAATTNRAELVRLADTVLMGSKKWRTYDLAGVVSALADVGLEDKAFDVALDLFVDEDGTAEMFCDAVLPLYRKAGRYRDIVDLVEGDPSFFVTNVLELVERSSFGVLEIYAEALAKVGRGGAAAAIAREVALRWHAHTSCGDWPFRILADEMDTGAFITLMDALYEADKFEERPLIWKAEALRRAGRLDEAEAVARKAVEIDPTDGETRAGDRIRSYAVLADILAARGAEKDAEFLREAVRAVRIAEEGDALTECGLVRRSLAKYEEAERHFSAAYCVQWRKAERLRALGRDEEAVRHYEETFRQLPAQFGFVASLCFGCAGIFASPGAVTIAERIVTEAASGKEPAPTACFLLGKLRVEQGRYEEAFDAFAKATSLAPDYLDAFVAQNALRFHVRRPLAEWERIQARIFALDPLGRHSDSGVFEILDWGLAKRLESEALRKLPAPDFDAIRKIVFPASAAKAARKMEEDGIFRRDSHPDYEYSPEARFFVSVSERRLSNSSFIRELATLVDILSGDEYNDGVLYCSAAEGDFGDEFLY